MSPTSPTPAARRPLSACVPAAVASVALSALLSLGCSRGDGDSDPGDQGAELHPDHRLVVVGWDGATFELIDLLLAAGRLPNVRRMMERGNQARLASTIIPISSAAWVGAVTGKGPGHTGVYSFFEPVEGSYDVRVVSSRSNRAVPIWRILNAHGLGVHVMGVPITYPPERVEGTLIAGMLSPFDAEYAQPRGLTEELRGRGFEPDLGIWRTEHGPTPKRLQTQLDLKRDIVLEHLGRDDWSFAMVVFKSLDVVSHGIYSRDLEGPVAVLLDRLDAILGEILDAVGEDTNVILMSDHGFRTYPQTFNLHAWMVAEGFSPKRDEAEAETVGPGDLATVRPLEHSARMGELDLGRTRAFAAACEGNFGSLRLNLAGREPGGIVRPEDAEALLDEIGQRLLQQQAGGEPVVTRVIRGHEMYPGPESDRIVPDLLFETREAIQVTISTSRPLLEANPRPFPDHARDGIFLAAGPDFAHVARGAGERDAHSVIDLAPLGLHLLGLPVPHEMEGQVPVGILSGERSVRYVHEAEAPGWPDPADAARHFDQQGSDTSEDVTARLKSLGYTDDAD